MKNQGLSPGTCDSLDVHFQVGPCSCPATPVIAETRQPSKTVKIGSESWMASYKVLALEVGMASFSELLEVGWNHQVDSDVYMCRNSTWIICASL